jgi:arylsulfatase A-like enzyme
MTNINRRAALRTTALGTLGLAAAVDEVFAQQPPSRPNIVFIMADDLGYADLSCYGRRDIKTPAIDLLASMGTRFLQAYANSPVCSATRTALITGRYQYRLRIGLEEPLLNPNVNVGLPPEHPTLPSLLKQAGYSTTLIGKWHLGMPPLFSPLKSGYDHFYGFRGGAIDYYTHRANNQQEDWWEDDVAVHETGYLTELLGDRAVRVIEQYGKARFNAVLNRQTPQPFFLSLHFSAPHWPWEAPGDEKESERLRGKSLFDFDGGTQDTYRRMVEALDKQVGLVLHTLNAQGLADETIIIFTSDNGGERFSDTWPFTGRKTELLEGGLRIPAIAYWSNRIAKGTTDQVAMSMDWMPTLLAAANVDPDPRFPPDGINLLPVLVPVLSGSILPIRRTVFWRYKTNAQRAVRNGDYKFLKIRDNTFLFNVVDDPMERANLKDRRKDVHDELADDWQDWNETMLPEIDESYVESFTGDQLADHIGSTKPSEKADTGK